MLVTLLGISTEVKLEQREKAYISMLVTLLPISTEVKLEQSQKAEGDIDTVPSLIVIDVLAGIVPLYLYNTFPA